MEDDDVGHEVVVVHLDLQPVSYLVEFIPNIVFGLHHHSHCQADLALQVDPVGNEGTVGLGLLAFFEDAHQQVCHSDQHKRMLEYLLILAVTPNVGNTDRVGGDKVVSFHNILGFPHKDLSYLLIILNPTIDLLHTGFKQVIAFPKALYVILSEVLVFQLRRRTGFQY